MNATNTSKINEVQFTDADVVNPDDFVPAGEEYPMGGVGTCNSRVRPWLLHDHGFVVAVVFADCLQDAIDIAVDKGKMERYLLSDEDWVDYSGPDDESISYLGNDCEPHDIETLQSIEFPSPPFSFVVLLNASLLDSI